MTHRSVMTAASMVGLDSWGLNLIGSRLLRLSKYSDVSLAGVDGMIKLGVRLRSLYLLRSSVKLVVELVVETLAVR